MQTIEQLDDFSFHATSNLEAKLSDYQGKWVILYFYPKDSTPGCTTESQDFRDLYADFQDLNAEIFGISRDGMKSHENFKAKHEFPFELISDADETICKLFDVIKLKKMYGKEYLGIERSTFLINPQGQVAHEWRKVKVKEHAKLVLEKLKELTS